MAPARRMCTRCERPQTVCVCPALPSGGKITVTTKVIVISHPCEKKKQTIGTVPLIDLCLTNFELVPLPADPADRNNHLKGSLANFPSIQRALNDKGTVLLFPGPSSVPIEEVLLPAGGDEQRALLVVDGTWRQAKKIMREDCIQQAIETQAVTVARLTTAQSSAYQFRREPRATFISTLEAVANALRVLEGNHDGDQAAAALEDAFRFMVDATVSRKQLKVLQTAARLSGQELESSLWAFARLQLVPTADVRTALLMRAEDIRDSLTTGQFVNVLWCLARLGLAPPAWMCITLCGWVVDQK